MVVLRSREILPTQPIPKSLTAPSTPEPVTPAQMNEPSTRLSSPSLSMNLENHQSVSDHVSNRRRSLRLASKSVPDGGCFQNESNKRKRPSSSRSVGRRKSASVMDRIVNAGNAKDNEAGGDVEGNSLGILGLRSGNRVVKRRVGYNVKKSIIERGRELEDKDSYAEENGNDKEMRGHVKKGKQNGESCVEVEFDAEQAVEKAIYNAVKEMKRVLEGGRRSQVSVVDEKLKEKLIVDECADSRETQIEKRDKEVVVTMTTTSLSLFSICDSRETQIEKRDKEVVVIVEPEKNQITNEGYNSKTRGMYSRNEKGKGKLADDDLTSNIKDTLQLNFESKIEVVTNDALELELKSKVEDLVDSVVDNLELENVRKSWKNETRMDVYRDIARKNASRFAYFDRQEQEGNFAPHHVDVEMPSGEEIQKVEDWPGPFSTAMKIIRDRANKLHSQQGPSTSPEAKSVPITWIPRKSGGSNTFRASVPSLQELCMRIIVKNVDALASLEHVPDAVRHRLCQLLCDCRSMNSCILELLLHGSPTEIRIKDCSWLTEEEFMKCFQGSDTNNLSVLQLDQCGRCLSDYLLPATLAKSSRSLPTLITLSLSGACRLTDIGLSSLLSSAPALRSINLSQCSLLTSTCIGTLAESLGSQLLELYIDDCQGLDAMLILPALKKLEHLEVLSLAGIQTVCDDFMKEFAIVRGHNMKELVLNNCVKLTDSSMKVIAETCPRLCALDLVNLWKLTDSALGYLANGCQEIQTLKLCRNAFSDEAIAAFLETSGEPLRELSLNNIKKVGNNTALSLARHSRNLLRLDLSFCRNMTDEAVGLIVDSCLSLRVLKLFGCGQITNVLLDGHSNPVVEIIGLKLSPVLEHIWGPDSQEFPLQFSSVPSFL